MKMISSRPLLAFLACLLLVQAGWSLPAQAWTGKVVKVQDGDTITVLAGNNRQVKIRLYGIDAPEKKQPYGARATEFMRRMAALQTVEVDAVTKDNYGRSVALVTVVGREETVNEAMIRAGLAWVYDAYCHKDQCRDWKEMQERTREERAGLWADRDPTPPWQWRKDKKGREDDEFMRLLRSIFR